MRFAAAENWFQPLIVIIGRSEAVTKLLWESFLLMKQCYKMLNVCLLCVFIVVLPMFGYVVCIFSHGVQILTLSALPATSFSLNIALIYTTCYYKKYLTYYTHIERNALIMK